MACLDKGVPRGELENLLISLTRISAKCGDYLAAAHYSQQALDFGFSSSDLHATHARALFKSAGDAKEIHTHFEKALELEERNWTAHDWFATFLKEVGEVDLAEQHARRAVQLAPRNAVALNNLAVLLLEWGGEANLREARDLLERAKELASPGFDYPTQNLALVLAKLSEE
jgi:Flp pilus assembly protein TadD